MDTKVTLSRPGVFKCAESDAHLFVGHIAELEGAPLKMCKSKVLDKLTPRKNALPQAAHITVTPAPGTTARVKATYITRRVNDQKKLNANGLAASTRDRRPCARLGGLWKGSIAWQLEFR